MPYGSYTEHDSYFWNANAKTAFGEKSPYFLNASLAEAGDAGPYGFYTEQESKFPLPTKEDAACGEQTLIG